MKDKMSRSELLGLGAAAGLGAVVTGTFGNEVQAQSTGSSSLPVVSAASLGISPSNTADQNRAAFVERLSDFTKHVIFEAGEYLFDNSDEPDNDNSRITIRNFSGKMTFLPQARVVFTDPTESGIYFDGGRGAVVENWNSAFRTAPDARQNAQECVACFDTTDMLFTNCRIDGSAAAGLLFAECIRPSVEGATITNTYADGLHFANCQAARAVNILTRNTGDDGLAFVNYGGRSDYWGGMATNIRVYDADARGISVVGQREVVISNFYVDTTAASGVIVAQEDGYDTRVPSDVRISNGIVKDSGAISDSDSPRDGVFLNDVGDNVEINDVRVVAPREAGLRALYSSNARSIHLSNIHIRDAAGSGVQIQDQAEVFLDEIVVNGSDGVGFHLAGNNRVNYGRLVSINTCKTDAADLAFNFERNRLIHGELLQIEATETQSANIGAKVNASGTHSASGRPQKGIYGRIDHIVETDTTFGFNNASNLTGTVQAG